MAIYRTGNASLRAPNAVGHQDRNMRYTCQPSSSVRAFGGDYQAGRKHLDTLEIYETIALH